MRAENLGGGDPFLAGPSDAPMYVSSKTLFHAEEPVRVYNLEVEYVHTYFVGKEGVLVHNWK